MYALRDKVGARGGHRAARLPQPRGRGAGINPFDHGPLHTDMWKTEGLKQALDLYGFDAAFGGARRDEEKSRAKERIFSFRTASHRWDPKNQRPELWSLYNARKSQGRERSGSSRSPTGPSSTSGNISMRERIEIVPLYLAAPRPTVERDGLLLMVDDERFPLSDGEMPVETRSVRFRTLGCYPLTGRGRERGRHASSRSSRRCCSPPPPSGRAGPSTAMPATASMEKKKQEGYF